jgi:hypothetical protein
MSEQVKDKFGNPIAIGDEVFTKIRGGRREGKVRFGPFQNRFPIHTEICKVEMIVTTEAEAQKEDVKNPPKVGRCPLLQNQE